MKRAKGLASQKKAPKQKKGALGQLAAVAPIGGSPIADLASELVVFIISLLEDAEMRLRNIEDLVYVRSPPRDEPPSLHAVRLVSKYFLQSVDRYRSELLPEKLLLACDELAKTHPMVATDSIDEMYGRPACVNPALQLAPQIHALRHSLLLPRLIRTAGLLSPLAKLEIEQVLLPVTTVKQMIRTQIDGTPHSQHVVSSVVIGTCEVELSHVFGYNSRESCIDEDYRLRCRGNFVFDSEDNDSKDDGSKDDDSKSWVTLVKFGRMREEVDSRVGPKPEAIVAIRSMLPPLEQIKSTRELIATLSLLAGDTLKSSKRFLCSIIPAEEGENSDYDDEDDGHGEAEFYGRNDFGDGEMDNDYGGDDSQEEDGGDEFTKDASVDEAFASILKFSEIASSLRHSEYFRLRRLNETERRILGRYGEQRLRMSVAAKGGANNEEELRSPSGHGVRDDNLRETVPIIQELVQSNAVMVISSKKTLIEAGEYSSWSRVESTLRVKWPLVDYSVLMRYKSDSGGYHDGPSCSLELLVFDDALADRLGIAAGMWLDLLSGGMKAAAGDERIDAVARTLLGGKMVGGKTAKSKSKTTTSAEASGNPIQRLATIVGAIAIMTSIPAPPIRRSGSSRDGLELVEEAVLSALYSLAARGY